MQTLINGIATDTISVMDRGLLYGDGAFETIATIDSKPVLLDRHLSRLADACTVLKLPFDKTSIESDIFKVLRNAEGKRVLKIIITRGAGGRGYKAAEPSTPSCIVQLFDEVTDTSEAAEKGICVTVCNHRLSQSAALAGIKHLNRLDQVLASLELGDGFSEGLCLDHEDNVIEGTKSNLVLCHNDTILVPSLGSSGVQGVMLAELLTRFELLGYRTLERQLKIADVLQADELFMCNSVIGVWPVIKLIGDDSVKEWPIGPICRQAAQLKNEIFNTSIHCQ